MADCGQPPYSSAPEPVSGSELVHFREMLEGLRWQLAETVERLEKLEEG